MDKPYKLDGVPAAPAPPAVSVDNPPSRQPRSGVEAGPPQLLGEEKPGEGAVKVMSGWTPGMGQNSAVIQQQNNPYQPAVKPAAPFKLNGQ